MKSVVEASMPNHLEKKGRTRSSEWHREKEINPWKREKRKSFQRDEGRIFMLAIIIAAGCCIVWRSGDTECLSGLRCASSVWGRCVGLFLLLLPSSAGSHVCPVCAPWTRWTGTERSVPSSLCHFQAGDVLAGGGVPQHSAAAVGPARLGAGGSHALHSGKFWVAQPDANACSEQRKETLFS